MLGLAFAVPAAAQGDLQAYVRARAADADGAGKLAAANYARALAAAPEDAVLAIRAYRQALAVGDDALAIRAATVLARAGTAPPDAALLAFAIALRGGDRAGAAGALMRLRGGALEFLAPALTGWLAFERGEDGAAAIEAAPGSALARRYSSRQRALLLLAQRRPTEGMAALALTLDGDDQRIDAALLLGQVGERERAAELIEGNRSEFRRLRTRLGKGRPTARAGAARTLVSVASDIAGEDMPLLSIALARMALILDPGEDRARLQLAAALSGEQEHGQALAVLAEIGRDSPYARRAASARIPILRSAGRADAALAEARALDTGRDATAEDAQVHGDLLAAADQFAAAAQAYAKAQGRTGTSDGWQLHYLQGTALERAGSWDAARAALRRAVELGPDEPDPLRYLGTAQVARGEDLAEAQSLLERARTLQPKDPTIADSLALAYYRRGDLDRAVPLLEEAVRADPAAAGPAEHLGDAYWRMGRRYEARYAWNAAASLASSDAAPRLQAKLRTGLAQAH